MKFLRYLLLLALPLAAHAVVSDPVGALRLKFRGASDTIVSLPLARSALVEATLAARSGNQLTLGADVPALPSEGAYGLVMSGALEGAVLPATSLSSRTVTVEAGAFDLSNLAVGDAVALIPYWTLDTLFPLGAGVHATATVALRQSEVSIFNDTIAGKNLSVSATYFYYGGTALAGAGWYKVGDAQNKAGGLRLPPQRYFIVRNNKAEDTTLTLTGGVQMAGFRVLLFTRAANTDQDNFVSLSVPVPIALQDTGLVASGAFRSTTVPELRTDELLVFDNTVVAKNKPVAATYFYYQGTAMQGTGWYKVGDANNKMDAALLRPGEGVIVRRQATATADTKQWTGLPTYLQ